MSPVPPCVFTSIVPLRCPGQEAMVIRVSTNKMVSWIQTSPALGNTLPTPSKVVTDGLGVLLMSILWHSLTAPINSKHMVNKVDESVNVLPVASLKSTVSTPTGAELLFKTRPVIPLEGVAETNFKSVGQLTVN